MVRINVEGEKIEMSDHEQQVLYDIYVELCEEHNWGEPEVEGPEFINNESSFTHVAYHVEGFGKNKQNYNVVAHLVE